MRRFALLGGGIGAIIGLAMLWGVMGMPGLVPLQQLWRAAPLGPATPCNPCRASGRRRTNPCNPGSGGSGAAGTAGVENPCNPGRPATAARNPCNPGIAAAGAANPCNPSPGSTGTSVAGAAQNPCNPCHPGNGSQGDPWDRTGEELEWADGYRTFRRVTGYVFSQPHGNRMVVTYITPAEAADIYNHNKRLAEANREAGYRDYPEGTIVAQASYTRPAQPEEQGDGHQPQRAAAATTTETGPANPCNPCSPRAAKANPCNPCSPHGAKANPCNPGSAGQEVRRAADGLGGPDAALAATLDDPAVEGLRPGPLFLMKKEAPGYDPEGQNWRYAAADRSLRVTIGNGASGRTQYCQSCHASAAERDYVFGR